MLGLEKIKKGKAVTTLRDTILARPLRPDCSAPASQLAALTEDFKYAKDKTVSAFTDGALFHEKFVKILVKIGLKSSDCIGKSYCTSHIGLLPSGGCCTSGLLQYVWKRSTHTQPGDSLTGKLTADAAAKMAARLETITQCVAVLESTLTPTADLQELQTRGSGVWIWVEDEPDWCFTQTLCCWNHCANYKEDTSTSWKRASHSRFWFALKACTLTNRGVWTM